MTIKATPLAALAVLAAGPVLAGDPAPAPADPAPAAQAALPQPDPWLVVTLGAGASVAPAYFGSDEYEVGPTGSFGLEGLRLGGLSFGDFDPDTASLGFGPRGSFRFVGARDSSAYSELGTLDDIDAAVELGLGLGYTARNLDAFAVARRGFGGHEGWVAEAGLDVIARPYSGLTVTAGPRVLWGDETFADTYFGVPTGGAGAGLPAYDADAGLVSAGLEFGATWSLSENWGLDTTLSWDRLSGDAADSPITANGSEDQWGLSVVLTRTFQLGG